MSMLVQGRFSSEPMLIDRLRANCTKLVYSLAVLLGIIFVMAVALRELELPAERERKAEERKLFDHHKFVVRSGVFDFFFPREMGLHCPGPFSLALSPNADPEWWNISKHAEEYAAFARTHRTYSCSECFAPDSDNFDSTRPQIDPDSEPTWWDMNEKVLSEGHGACQRVDDTLVDDAFADGWQEHWKPDANLSEDVMHMYKQNRGCILLCPLKLPTVEQVEACRLKDGKRNNKFNMSCLQNTPTCPNCNSLSQQSAIPSMAAAAGKLGSEDVEALDNWLKNKQGQVSGIKSHMSETFMSRNDPDMNSAVFTADVYITYKRLLEQGAPSELYNWEFKGCVFFATTILTTIGYGSFAPTTDGAKVLLSLLSIPGITIFGVALGQMASLTVAGVAELQRLANDVWGGKKRSKHSNENVMKVCASLIRAYDTDRSGRFSIAEMVPLAGALVHILDSPNCEVEKLVEKAEGLSRVGTTDILALKITIQQAEQQAEPQAECSDAIEQELAQAFAKAMGVDANGEIDLVEAMTILDKLARSHQKRRQTSDSEEQLYILLALSTVYLGIGMFNCVIEDIPAVDAWYYTMITVTSIGLGDYAPNFHSPSALCFWMAYVLATMGLVASIIGKLEKTSFEWPCRMAREGDGQVSNGLAVDSEVLPQVESVSDDGTQAEQPDEVKDLVAAMVLTLAAGPQSRTDKQLQPDATTC